MKKSTNTDALKGSTEEERSLNEFVKSVMKNEVVFQILKQHISSEHEYEKLQELQQSAVLSNEDWRILEARFNLVYGDFIQKIRHSYPRLSQGEVRFLSLIKLGLSKNEIALLMGIASGSLRVTWFRIRKKLAMSEEVSVEEFVADIN